MNQTSQRHKPWLMMGMLGLLLGITSIPSVGMAKGMDEQFMMLMAARNAVKAQKYDIAIQRYRKVLRKSESHVEVRAELGWVLLKTGKFKDGQREFEAVLAKDPNNTNALRGRLESARKSKDLKAEFEVLNRLVRVSPNDRELRKQLALALHNQGKYAEAEKHLGILMGE